MPEEMLDFHNLLTIRNQLVKASDEKLRELYQDKGSYVTFLDTVILLTESDSAFLLFSDQFIDKILSVVQLHRFDFEEDEIKEAINGIITYMNHIRTYSSDLVNQLKNGYLAYQEDLREAEFHSDEAFFKSLSYDAVVFSALREGKPESVEDDSYFLMSLNFLLKSCPELFQDATVKKGATVLLDRAYRHSGILSSKKKMVKGVMRNYQDVVSQNG